MSHNISFKFILLGDSGVGKSCLLAQLTKQEFQETPDLTIGLDYASHLLQHGDKNIKLQLWDMGGQEQLQDSMGQFYSGATCAFLVFDLCDRSTFLRLNTWMRSLKELVSNQALVIYLLGNKVDLADNQWGSIVPQGRGVSKMRTREVSRAEAQRFAEANNLTYVETSAKSGLNVVEAFEDASRLVMNRIYDNEYDVMRYPEVHGIRYAERLSSGPRRPPAMHSQNFGLFSCCSPCIPAGMSC